VIAKLRGLLDSSDTDMAVVDVGGVGYAVFCSTRTLARLPAVGEPVTLHVETHVREDHIHLYGFLDPAERSWFRLLTTVQGVGARVALAVLSVLGPEELVRAVAAEDKRAVARAEGVGPKLAARVVAELKDKVGGIALGPVAATAAAEDSDNVAARDAVSALVNLGYGRSEAFGAVNQALGRLGNSADVAALIRAGLQELAE
jgi:Holliday junction DNA helicase RuvA